MTEIPHYIPAILSSILSAGFFTFITFLIQRRDEKKRGQSAESRMLLGLGHEEIITACEKYIKLGTISVDEFDDLNKYLYQPYKALGGNGTAEVLMSKVEDLIEK